jgi:ABC-type Mn2+/Zn2+ transport system permease subunit
VLFALETLILSLSIGVAVGVSGGYLGSLMVLKKMALVGDAFSHVALPGLALGLLFHFPVFLGAFAVLFVSAVVVWQLGRVTKLSYESIVGATFTLALAIGILMVVNGQLDLLEALFGDITNVTLFDATTAVAISIVAILLTKMIYKKLVLGMISEELAISKGISVSKTDLLYLLLVSLVVATGIKIVGSLLVGFLVAVPAASAKNISSNLLKYSVMSSAFGAISASSGVLLSNYLNLQSGPMVVISGITVFAVTVALRWKAK